jgi:fructosamine-3-kinase
MSSISLPAEVIDNIGSDILQIESLPGGSISHTHKITTNKGIFLLKHADAIPADLYQAEAQGLKTIGASGAFNTPEIILINENYLLMSFIAARPMPNWAQCGEQLAHLHQHHAAHYGFAHNNYFATLPQKNTWQTEWLTFYREQRLRPLLDQPLLTTDDKNRLEKILNKLDNTIDNSEPPALIHGDLWSANIIFNPSAIYLIDPACYYASREIEIAYLEFVGDSHTALLQAYQDAYPLSTDYTDRKNFYLLYPYLCHLKLYGASYLPGLRDLLGYLM